MTDEQYVESSGKGCPFCGFWQVEGEGVDVQEGRCVQEVTCQRCLASWYDEYKLTGYTTINTPEVEDDDEEEG